MSKKIPWDSHETALLVEAYMLIEEDKIERKVAVKLISEELRRKARISGQDIDSVFRNTNGISMRLYEIQYIVSPENGGMKNTSRLFKDIVEMYFNRRSEFEKLLQKAKEMVEASEGKDNRFLSWTKANKVESEYELVEINLRIVNAFGRKQKLFNNSLEKIIDPDELDRISKKIVNDNVFGVKKKRLQNFWSLFAVYNEYLKSNNWKEETRSIADSYTGDGDSVVRRFTSWMLDELKVTEKTAKSYASAINTIAPHVKQFCKTEEVVYDITESNKLAELIKVLYENEEFKKINMRSHNRFKAALDKYLQFVSTVSGETDFIAGSFLGGTDITVDLSEIEDIIIEADIDGIAVHDIAVQTGKSVWLIKKNLRQMKNVIEVPEEVIIHADSLVDLYENKEAVRKILLSQFFKFAGYTNDVVHYDAATISLGLFLNDNNIDSPEKMYGVARYLFKEEFFFGADKHIWKKQPKFPLTNSGVLIGFINSSDRKASKNQCKEYLQKVKLDSRNPNSLLSMATNKEVLFYGDEEYVIACNIIGDDTWLGKLREAVKKLFKNSIYVIPREIKSTWFDILPQPVCGLAWNLALLQDIVKKYLPEYRLITANEDQSLETIRAGIVMKESTIMDFGDLVYVRMLEDSAVTMPIRINKEDFRQRLIEYKMIQGNELIYTMPKALNGSKYVWADDGESVLVL